mmetsp:Transcript_10097/g.17042  ORF Transcript_10097/g.17042 Transcript_10097/m.17042 type:complete len:80 (+) Transcript_10097:897-1136(+)
MVEHLASDDVKEVAIDLEAHQMRSYLGLTCLMQISSRTQDFIVDSIKLRALLQSALQPILADPAKVKVLHGADMDVEWL